MYLASNVLGDILWEFISIEEKKMYSQRDFEPLTHSLIIAKYHDKYLFVYNKKRQQWEIPGGKIYDKESARDCIIRELNEESNQKPNNLKFKGLMKYSLHPDNRVEFGSLFQCKIKHLNPFIPNNETEGIIFLDLQASLTAQINPIDIKLIELTKCLE